MQWQLTVIERYVRYISEEDASEAVRRVASNLCALYALWSLEKHMSTLYQGIVYLVKPFWGRK